jgi:hypothetical protein
MALGNGLSSSFGIATETTPGTPVVVTRFAEFDSETLALKRHTVQGAGLRGGGLVKRAQRRALVAREVAGDVTFDAMTAGLGLFLQHMLGSTPGAPTSLGGGLFQQIHTPGSLQGLAFTTQIVKPDTTGVLSSAAFTYPGCKVTDWELSVAQHAQLKLKLTIDALDEATPSNAVAPTTLSALTVAAATSFTTAATIPAGSYVVVDTGLNAEVVQTGAPSGAGPFTIPVTTPGGLSKAHASGVYVGSATAVNYGTPAGLQSPSYTAGLSMFTFDGGKLVAGGTTSVVSGVWTQTGGQTVANVRTVSLKGKNALKVDRWGLGNKVRNEQLDNNFRDYTSDFEVEYNGRAFYDAYAADLPIALVFSFTGPGGAKLSLYAPVGFQEDGSGPQVAGPDIIIQKFKTTLLDDGVNGSLQVVYTSTDAAV